MDEVIENTSFNKFVDLLIVVCCATAFCFTIKEMSSCHQNVRGTLKYYQHLDVHDHEHITDEGKEVNE